MLGWSSVNIFGNLIVAMCLGKRFSFLRVIKKLIWRFVETTFSAYDWTLAVMRCTRELPNYFNYLQYNNANYLVMKISKIVITPS